MESETRGRAESRAPRPLLRGPHLLTAANLVPGVHDRGVLALAAQNLVRARAPRPQLVAPLAPGEPVAAPLADQLVVAVLSLELVPSRSAVGAVVTGARLDAVAPATAADVVPGDAPEQHVALLGAPDLLPAPAVAGAAEPARRGRGRKRDLVHVDRVAARNAEVEVRSRAVVGDRGVGIHLPAEHVGDPLVRLLRDEEAGLLEAQRPVGLLDEVDH